MEKKIQKTTENDIKRREEKSMREKEREYKIKIQGFETENEQRSYARRNRNMQKENHIKHDEHDECMINTFKASVDYVDLFTYEMLMTWSIGSIACMINVARQTRTKQQEKREILEAETFWLLFELFILCVCFEYK